MSDEKQPTTNGTAKGKPGRPKKHVDLEMVEKLAHIQCTYAEIASTLGVSVDTLQRNEHFSAIYKRGAEGGQKVAPKDAVRVRKPRECRHANLAGKKLFGAVGSRHGNPHLARRHGPEAASVFGILYAWRTTQRIHVMDEAQQMMEARLRELRSENPRTIDILPAPSDDDGSSST